jgi:hypothetical protein
MHYDNGAVWKVSGTLGNAWGIPIKFHRKLECVLGNAWSRMELPMSSP